MAPLTVSARCLCVLSLSLAQGGIPAQTRVRLLIFFMLMVRKQEWLFRGKAVGLRLAPQLSYLAARRPSVGHLVPPTAFHQEPDDYEAGDVAQGQRKIA